jgi:hypothetical protein
MMQLAWAINWELIPAYGNPSLQFSGPAKNKWYNTNQTVSWTLSDSGSSGYPAPGVAGFTQGWDSIPADPYSQPNGGTGNSFYSGPQFPYATEGCLAFNGNGCAGGSGQGCHTVQVRGWDNQGVTTTGSYGPLCFDSVAPTISLSTIPTVGSNGFFNNSVSVSLSANDSGGSTASGIYKTYYSEGSQLCSSGYPNGCAVYSSPLTISGEGYHYLYYMTSDNAGNYSPIEYDRIAIDETAPLTVANLGGGFSAGAYSTVVSVVLNAGDSFSGVQYTYYALDGGQLMVYNGQFIVSTLGSHTLQYWSSDKAGNVEAKHTLNFSITSPTVATITGSPANAVLGQQVTITATVTATISGVPTGSVIFYAGATNLGTATLSGGVATLKTTALPLGGFSLQASYPGAGNYRATNSAGFTETVQESTTTTVSSSLNPSTFGTSITFTAHVTPAVSGTLTGSVEFFSGTALLGSGNPINGVATFATSALNPGSFPIKAVYSGDATHLTSQSTVLTQIVNALTQTLTFPAISTQLPGTLVPLSATASSGLPVSFISTTPAVCSVTGSTATLLKAGSCTIVAVQAGNTDYLPAKAVTSFTVSTSSTGSR